MKPPALLLDVDGPLNPYAAKPHRRPQGYTTHRMRPTGWQDPKPLRVWLNPAHGARLLVLPFELVWATAWEHQANKLIGPPLGLPELPVIDWPALDTPGRGRLHWKTRRVVEWADGRPFAWVDDEITEADREFVAARHDGRALLHWVDPRLGLLGPDFDALTAWAATVTAPA